MPLSHETMTQLQALLWADPAQRKQLQDHGLNLVPANFYSTVPSFEELEASFEHAEPTPYLHNGIFDETRMAEVLEELVPYSRELDGPLNDNPDAPAGFFWENGQFGYSDAAAYYAFIRSRKPRRILEIGSGFSTLVASAAIEANGHGEIHCIEPYPRPFLDSIRHVRNVVREPVQGISAGWMNNLLQDGDILFIDSTHTVKIGSDCLHLYLRVLPALSRRLLVHVHDVFLPEAMPRHWALQQHIYWTEQYLLLAYLLDNPKTSVLFGSNYNKLFSSDRLALMTPEGIPIGGSSFWFERRP